MARPFKGVVNVDVTESVPDWGPYIQPIAPDGTPSVLYIVLDDVGFSAMEPFGGMIETPNINRIAERGFVGLQEQIVESSEPVPTGHVVLSASFEKEGDAMPTEGTLTLHMREAAVGEGKISTQPGKFSLAGEGLNVGKEGAEPVTDDYPGEYPWAFVGGTVHKCVIDASDKPFVDLANEVRMAFARD